ncbi:hypothetical protein EDB81DRAFT_855820 [Dactylonectria macrodidyma]|uniref:NAD(P)-binding domain-containing protein n=1 Tax=Dactylonectria macrodidyma TaxID=307937 RepID=A0A9P9F5Z2_9HYPO|nr:hypothetical protein EDB81DRAFT_855820 [Dactylonectria macrodidyma]
MVTVAVAGGTGGVGRTLVDALRNDGNHQTIVLARKVPEGLELGVPVIEVDYNDIDALQAVLNEHQIHTVISALALHIIGVGESQLNLIEAAHRNSSTKRFVSSTWAVRPSSEYLDLLPHGFQHNAAYAALEKTNLEWTAFNLGWFLEYYGMPHVETYIPQTTFVVDMAGKHASIPGDGKQKMTFTYSHDVAKFVVASLDLPKWDRDTYVIGDKMTWEEVVKLAEEIRGEKFTVTYDSVEKLRAGEITELPGQVAAYSYFPKEWVQRLFSTFGFWVTEGIFDFPEDKALNHQFPDIKVTTVEDMLDAAWGRNQVTQNK